MKSTICRFKCCLTASLLLFGSMPAFPASYVRGSINAGGTARASIGRIGSGFGYIARTAVSASKASRLNRAPGPNPEFKLGEVYAFPNPAKKGKKPTVHVETGLADSVTLKFFDIAGDLVHQAEITSLPPVVNDGHGQEYAYEYTWDGSIPSGAYICSIKASKAGKDDIRATVKLAVIR